MAVAMSAGFVGFSCLIGGWSIRSYLKGSNDLRRQDVRRAAFYTLAVEAFLGFWFFMLADDLSISVDRFFLVFMVVAAVVASFAGAASAKNSVSNVH